MRRFRAWSHHAKSDRATSESAPAHKAIDGLKDKLGTLAGVAVVGGFAKGTISEASDLGESLNVAGLIFEDLQSGAIDFGEGAAEAIGLSTTVALTAQAQFGGMPQNLGFANEASLDWTRSPFNSLGKVFWMKTSLSHLLHP